MNILGISARRAVVALAFLAACSVPSQSYTPLDDAGIDAPTDASEVVELQVSTMTVMVTEALTATFTVQLTAQPATDVIVSVDSADDNRVGVAPTSIQFTPQNWNTPRTVTVSGREDADTEDEQVNVNLSSSVGGKTIAVTVDDNDTLRIVTNPMTTLQVTEGQSSQIAVHLSAQPSGPVTVTVMSSDTNAATVSPATLTFGTGTWDVDQNVVVSGVSDADTADATATVMLTEPTLQGASVAITVVDDDVLGIVPSTSNLGTLTEGGMTTFTVRLSQQPLSNVTVTVASSDTAVLTATPSPLTFTTANWMTPQTITVNLPQDIDTANESATITLTASGVTPAPTPRTVSAAITDDDTQVVVATPDPITIDETMTGTINVHLQFQPSADITLTVTSLNTAVATVSPATLTFTPANYATNQAVTVTAVDDADAAPGSTAIRLESLPDSLSKNVGVAVIDNDQLLIESSTTSVTVAENGTVMFGVHLTAMPGADITVSVSSGDPTAATVSPAMLTFTPANYASFQMVTVTGVSDADLANETLMLTLSAAGLIPRTVNATVTDDDMQAVSVSSGTITVTEGLTGQVGVSLAFMPAANVIVNVASVDPTAATVSPATLTFTPANYATPQNITITGASDADAANDNTMINLTATGATPASVTVTVNDDDQLGIVATVANINCNEPSTATFGVHLSAQPPADTMVMVMSSDVSAATVAPAVLTFTTSNYASNQTVTITGVSDADGVNDTLTVNLTATGLTAVPVNVTVVDDDVQDILLSATTLTVGEAGSNTFNVHLAAMPAANVVVSVASADTNKATASPSMLTFTPANYMTDQTVTVSGAQDLNLTNESVNVNLTSPGVTTRSVTVTVNDDDTQVVETTAVSPVAITEGNSVNVGFKLRYMPAANVTVTLNLGTGLSVAGGNTLTFTTANYNTEQTKSITAVQDADAAPLSTSLTATAPSATSATVNFDITDDDVLLLDVTPLSLTVNEGLTGTYQVRLTAQPLATTTVTSAITTGGMAIAIDSGANLTFTTGNYNTYQTVTISGTPDVNVTNEGANIQVSSAPIPSKNVSVTVQDDDVVSILTSVSTTTVNEGSTTTFTASLSYMPTSNVVVTVASSIPSNILVTVPPTPPSTLTFTPANYSMAQNITISGVQDADSDDRTGDISLTASGLTTHTVTATVFDDDIIVNDVVTQMGPAAGGTYTGVIGAGFSGSLTVTMSNNPVTNQMIPSSQEVYFNTPAKSAAATNWSDVKVSKVTTSVTIPRAFYYGQWTKATGIWGGNGNAIAAPANTSIVYTTIDSDFYKSTDGGANFTKMAATGLPQGSSYAMAVPSTDSNTVYVAAYTGLFKSTDGAATFTEVGAFDQTSCISISPASVTTMLLCSAGNMYRTTDGGANWTMVLAGIPMFGYGDNPSWTTDGTNVYYSGNGNNVYRSSNGGATWATVNGNLPTNQSKQTVIVHPTAPLTAWLGQYPSFWKTTNGGSSWTQYTALNAYPSHMAINPTNPLILYATTVGNGVYKTTDGGTTWVASTTGINGRAWSFRSLTLRGSSNELYTGSQGAAIHRSTDAGANWTFSSTGIAESTAFQITPHPTTSGTVWVMHDGGFVKSTNHGATFADAPTQGLPTNAYSYGQIVFMPGTPSTMYMAVSNFGVYKSTDSGATWAATGLTTNQGITSLLVDPANPQHVYATVTGYGVYKSTNAGGTWTTMNTGLTDPGLNISELKLVGGQLLLIQNGVGVTKYNAATATWGPTTGAPTSSYWLFVDPFVSGTAYTTNFNDLFRSTDSGSTWALWQSGYNSLMWDPTRQQTIYVYRSYSALNRTINGFQSVEPFFDGLTTGDSFCRFAIDRLGATVYMAPGSGGFYRIND